MIELTIYGSTYSDTKVLWVNPKQITYLRKHDDHTSVHVPNDILYVKETVEQILELIEYS